MTRTSECGGLVGQSVAAPVGTATTWLLIERATPIPSSMTATAAAPAMRALMLGPCRAGSPRAKRRRCSRRGTFHGPQLSHRLVFRHGLLQPLVHGFDVVVDPRDHLFPHVFRE